VPLAESHKSDDVVSRLTVTPWVAIAVMEDAVATG